MFNAINFTANIICVLIHKNTYNKLIRSSKTQVKAIFFLKRNFYGKHSLKHVSYFSIFTLVLFFSSLKAQYPSKSPAFKVLLSTNTEIAYCQQNVNRLSKVKVGH